MTTTQKIIKYAAIVLAVIIIISIISGIASLIFNVIGLVFGFSDKDSGEVTTLTYDSSVITQLDIEVEATDLVIVVGDTAKVEYTGSRITSKLDGSTLVIEEKSKSIFSFGKNINSLTLTLPSTDIEKVNISTGAGRLNMSGLNIQTLELQLDVGDSKLENINVSQKTDICCDVGNLDIKSSVLSSLELELNIGNASIEAELIGTSSIQCDIGDLDLMLMGEKESYTVRADKDLGDVTVDGSSISDMTTVGAGANLISIQADIGKVNVSFEQ